MTLGFLTTPLLGLVDTAGRRPARQGGAARGLAVGAVMFDLIFTTFNSCVPATTGLVAQGLWTWRPREQQAVSGVRS